MKTITELRDYLLKNYIDEDGDLYMVGLDFSDFDGDIYISGMKVKGNLVTGGCEVGGYLDQGNQTVKGDYACMGVEFGGDIYVDEPTKLLKKATREDIVKMGYDAIIHKF